MKTRGAATKSRLRESATEKRIKAQKKEPSMKRSAAPAEKIKSRQGSSRSATQEEHKMSRVLVHRNELVIMDI
jgi:hypothetical protein